MAVRAPRFSSTVDGVLARSAARHPHRVALRFDGRTWTYAQLDDAVSRVASRLIGVGLDRGERVAAYARNSDAYVLLLLACSRAGLVHVPVNYNVFGRELVHLVGQSGCSALFCDPSLEAEVDAVDDQLPSVRLRGRVRGGDVNGDGFADRHDVLGWGCDQSIATPQIDVDVRDEDLVQLLYTSGTTSLPKGAMLSHRALVHEYVSCVHALDLREDDRWLHALPLYHSAQQHVFLLPSLMVGATGDLVEAPDPADVLRRIEEDRITAFFAPPTVWIALSQHPDFKTRDLSSLTKAYYGASIMPTPVLQQLRAALPGLGFYNCFGQSEIGPLVTVLRPEEHDERPASAGRAVLFVELRVVDEDGHDVPAGTQGEALYRSPQLCSGYWDMPEETAEAFAGGWFHSGDLVVRDAEGFITVVDRVKDVINTGGILVSSREVEEVLYTHPAVAEVAVVALPDPLWVEAVTAIVVPVKGASPSEEELLEHARAELSGFKVPKAIHLVDALPKNPSGKVLKRDLRDRFATEAAPG